MTMQNQEQLNQARNKLIQVYRYLQALDQLHNPVQRQINDQLWVMWFRDLPDHPTIQHGTLQGAGFEDHCDNNGNVTGIDMDIRSGDSFILKVRRPILNRVPEPPLAILPWLQDGWQNIDGNVAVQPTRTENDAEGHTQLVHFEDDPQRPALLKEWSAKRDEWIEIERPARRAMEIFEKLYALQAHIEREAERVDLVLGDGLLVWSRRGGDDIHHPVLLQRLQLHFEPSIPEFTLLETEDNPELYSALFRSMTDVNPVSIGRCREELEQRSWHPLGGDETDTYMKRIVMQLHAHGEFIGHGIPRSERNIPRIGREPALFLRRRNLGFSAFIEAILNDLPRREDIPHPWKTIVGIDSKGVVEPVEDGGISSHDDWNGEDETVLLCKEANAEQLEIARRVERHGGVIVQGPPGTGKTHTIANLLGHLLAQGKSVLVTSHTAKALKVLREKVVEPLQPLCVSVLDDSRQQMESSVDAITERLSSSNADTLEHEAASLIRDRGELLRQLRETRQQLLQARQDEYRPIVVAGEEYPPSQAARLVAEKRTTSSWIPSPVTLGVPLPLSIGEVIDLYRSNVVVTSEDEKELAVLLPDPEELMPPVDFERLVTEQSRLSEEELDYQRDLWDEGGDSRDLGYEISTEPSPGELNDLLDQLTQAVEPLRDGTGWRLAAITSGREGDVHRQPWDDLITEIQTVFDQDARVRPLLMQFGPDVPEDGLPNHVERVLEGIAQHLRRGGKLGRLALFMKRDWKLLIDRVRIKGHPPELLEHFEALLAFVRLRSARANLLDRWQRQMAPLDGPTVIDLGSEPEKACRQYCDPIRHCLDWFTNNWLPLENKLKQMGFRWDVFLASMPTNLAPYGDLLRLRDAVLDRLPQVIAAQENRIAWVQNKAQLFDLVRCLDKTGIHATAVGVLQRLRETVTKLDSQGYQEAYGRLVDLHLRREELKRRNDLLEKLEQVAPAWAMAIRDREGDHGRGELPGDPVEAWRWRQIHDELERRAQISMEELQARLAQLGEELRRITATLVEKKAWAAQVRRTTLQQRQALLGWKAHVRKAGRRTGIKAPKLLAEARRLMPVCQSAVPVWIMPLSRVVENFDPKKNHFDVVIIDEASQANVMAMTALYLGKQIIVVGDDEQVSPVSVGQRIDEVQPLIDAFLQGIPNKNLYDEQSSIYDLAKTSFEGMVCLREHFRCVSPIIQFSNHLSYEGDIKPLRDASDVRRRPHTVAYRVEGAASTNNTNEEEARTVASLLAACVEQPEYNDATFGVISLVGDEQAMRIDTLLQRFLPTSEYIHRRVQCGNSAQFQGDERDVMFLSMVHSPRGNGPLPRVPDPGDLFKKRFNVAASRARDQMWVIHSLDPDTDLQPDDLRRRLIQHAKDPEALLRLLDTQEKRAESEFEKLVLRRLVQAGYRVTPQCSVGAYRIDMMIQGDGKRLAVECDGDRWHPPEKLQEDMGRQAILERLGLRFVRIRGSQFFRDPDKAMEPVFTRLQGLEIQPEGSEVTVSGQNIGIEELKERIIRRAAELRQQWAESGEDTAAGITPKTSAITRGWRNRQRLKDTSSSETIEAVQSKDTSDRIHLPTENVSSEQFPRKGGSQLTIDSSIKHSPQLEGVFDLLAFLNQKGAEVIDKRSAGGALWVIGGTELSSIMAELKTKGIRFTFAKAGGRSTRHRPAWFKS